MKGITGNREFKHTGPLLHVLKSKNCHQTNKRVSQRQEAGGRAEEISHDFWRLLWAGIQQLDDLLGLATNIPNS